MKHLLMSAAMSAMAVILLSGCRTNGNSATRDEDSAKGDGVVIGGRFDADSAYAYVDRQVAFGPRVPGTEASAACATWLQDELVRHGADTVKTQTGVVTAYNGDRLPITNIMASFKPEARERILLLAHYDTRPWADSDDREENRLLPIPGANDGASGVGVLLEVARHLGQQEPKVGVDILFVDAEDYGQSSGFSIHDESWALGTQYWVAHLPYAQDSLPRYAVLLDMVGGIDAKFHREYFSNQSAPGIVDKVWSAAVCAGYGDRFVNVDGGAVIDDHFYVNQAGIPAIDIIESKNEVTKSFNPTWHTAQDNMDNIDRRTLKAVGQTVLNVVYSEKP